MSEQGKAGMQGRDGAWPLWGPACWSEACIMGQGPGVSAEGEV